MTMQKAVIQQSIKTHYSGHSERLVMVQEGAMKEQKGLRRPFSSGDKSKLSTPSGPTPA